MSSDTTESELVANLVAAGAGGDRRAQAELLKHYWPLIRRVVRTQLKRSGEQLRMREAPEDLDQEVGIRLLTELPRHQWQGRQAFMAWVKRVADNRVRDLGRYHRAKLRDRAAETVEERADAVVHDQRSPESRVDQATRRAVLEQQLAEIKPEYAAAVQLNQMGYSHAEIGEMLSCTAEAARKLVARGMSKLSKLRTPGRSR